MIPYEDLFNFILAKESNNNNDIFSSDDYHSNEYIESFFDSLLSSIVNKTKNDIGNYELLDDILKIRKKISKESSKQYKVIISYCKESEIPNVKTALKKYNFLHFLKLIIRIIDIDEEYCLKVEECKKYFNNPQYMGIYQYLYENREVPYLKLKELSKHKLDSSELMNDLILITTKHDNSTTYSLSPKGKNLYAFFMMKNIDIESLGENYNEAKVNEVLEYLIQYILSESSQKRSQLKKPSLNSSSANYNLNRVTDLIDRKNNYSRNFVQHFSEEDSKVFNYKGEKSWKVY